MITIYALRFKIETSFGEQKNEMGTFAYHFWTTALTKLQIGLSIATEILRQHRRIACKTGHLEHFRVTYWDIGNENFGEWEIGHQSAAGWLMAGRAAFSKVKTDYTIKEGFATGKII